MHNIYYTSVYSGFLLFSRSIRKKYLIDSKRRSQRSKHAVRERVLLWLWLNKKRASRFLQTTALRKWREIESWTTTTLVLTVIPKSDERQSNAGILQRHYYPLCRLRSSSFSFLFPPVFFYLGLLIAVSTFSRKIVKKKKNERNGKRREEDRN